MPQSALRSLKHATFPVGIKDCQFETRHLTLGAIYLLGERSDDYDGPRVRIISGAGGLRSLIANTYAFATFDDEMRAREFGLLSRLATQMPLRSVVPFADLTRIGELCDLVVNDSQNLPHPNFTADARAHVHV